MRLIRKTAAPSSFQTYIREETADYLDMDAAVKEALRDALINEQKGVCAYCEQVLVTGKIKIEHHCERSICNGENGTKDRRLDYTNLFAVCLGKGGMKSELHCDSLKANFNQTNGLPIAVLPTNAAHIQTLKYAITGRISSTNPQFHDEINRILNLNIDYIKDRRKQKWAMIFSKSLNRNKQVNKQKMAKLIEADLTLKNGKFVNSFPALSEFMRAKFC